MVTLFFKTITPKIVHENSSLSLAPHNIHLGFRFLQSFNFTFIWLAFLQEQAQLAKTRRKEW